MIKCFFQFINESAEDAKSEREALDYLLSVGLISKEQHRKDLAVSSRIHNPPATDRLSPAAMTAVNSPEAKALLDAGLYLVSSNIRNVRGNLVYGPASYDRAEDYALGFFPQIRKVRRMTPKAPLRDRYGGLWRSNPPQDDTIKEFTMARSDDEFYKIAMRWVLDHVDLDYERTHFPVKKKTARGYFDQSRD
jgi:hypothetical protein